MDAFDISASALTAQRLRMDIISGNLANVNTTRKTDGSVGAYRRKNVVFAPLLQDAAASAASKSDPFSVGDFLSGAGKGFGSSSGTLTARALFQEKSPAGVGVSVIQITDDKTTPMRLTYDPAHPDANKDGYVEMPNINVVTEMVDMISASRAYEANVTALQSTKGMNQAALQI
jgi:flagellar basal-body rod protein FlgC